MRLKPENIAASVYLKTYIMIKTRAMTFLSDESRLISERKLLKRIKPAKIE